ncbi:MAG TPA: hypothetical protein VKF62_02135 [Planctomycetota bacterium]|nr:hypothetical protein [Planctomycetota bacterium]
MDLLRHVAVSLALLSCLAACGGKRPDSPAYHYISISGARGGVTIERAGVRIEIDGALFELVQNPALGSPSEGRMTVEGHPLSFEGRRLRLGETDYGEVAAGDVVRMTREGVVVNGALRGPLPTSRPSR